jgi:phage FluMu protein Com
MEAKKNVINSVESDSKDVVNDLSSVESGLTSVKCPNCKSADVDVQVSETEMYYVPFKDIDGKTHNHDDNTGCLEIRCATCNKRSETPVPDHLLHRCWCGWVQNKPYLGYQGKVMFVNL